MTIPKQVAAYMSTIGKKRMAKLTTEERRELALKAVAAKAKKAAASRENGGKGGRPKRNDKPTTEGSK